jgi:hypothetical protein
VDPKLAYLQMKQAMEAQTGGSDSGAGGKWLVR